MKLPPTERFGRRVNAYVQGRPDYPQGVFDFLLEVIPAGSSVIDLGAGTGIFTKGLLRSGYLVQAVEPNEKMRASLEPHINLTVSEGRAESIPAPDGKADMITAAQAAHWFDPTAAVTEMRRVLRPAGWVAFVWNERVPHGAGAAYQALVNEFKHHEPGARDGSQPLPGIDAYFRGGEPDPHIFDNPQSMDFEGLVARAASSSYLPHPGDEQFEPMVSALRSLFETHSVEGVLTLPQATHLFLGQISI
ncbi:MAG: class I SAM-dependent methyltransferase [Fimbriimonadaceae bacterium]|nr:class I SAM-dependent methyltransferase [Fimbriimonadaceae bacterium]